MIYYSSSKLMIKMFLLFLFVLTILFNPQHAVASRTVRAAIFNFKPLVYSGTDGSAQGFFVKILNHVAQKENWNVLYVPGTWQEGMDRLKNNQVDLMVCIGNTEEREKYMDFPKEYLILDWGVIYKAKGSTINNIFDLEGKTVSVLKGSVYPAGFQELANKFHIKVTFKEMSKASDVLASVVSGKADAAVAPNLSGILNDDWQRVDRTPIIFTPVKQTFGVNDGKNSDLIAALDNEIAALKADRNSVYYQEFEHLMGKSEYEIPKKVYWAIICIVALLFITIFFLVLLKRQVRVKTEHLEAEIAVRKHAEEALKKSNEQFLGLVTNIPGHIAFVNANTLQYEYVNMAYQKSFGIALENIIGQHVKNIIGEANFQYAIRYINEAQAGKYVSYENTFDMISGKNWNEVTYNPIVDADGHVSSIVVLSYDITERKQAEAEKARFILYQRAILDNLPMMAWLKDIESRLEMVNEPYAKACGHSVDECIGKTDLELFPYEMAKVYMDDDREVCFSGQKKHVEEAIATPEGIRWHHTYKTPIFDEQGNVIGTAGIAQDITDRKKIEEIQTFLLNSNTHPQDVDFFESLARYLANTLGMDYVCIDSLQGDNLLATTLAVYHDGKFEDNVTYTLKDTPCGDAVGKEVCVFPSRVRELFPKDEALQDLQAESYVGTTLWSFDMKPIGLIAVIGRKELNSSHFAETVLKLVSLRAASELERMLREAEKQVLEQQLQHTQKLESLGVLSGGIAHDFNNILAIIMGYCSLTKMDYDTAENNILEIEKAAERAAGLCRQMLAYAGKAQLTKTQINMRSLVVEMVTMLKATLPQNAEINPDLSTDVPVINGDSNQIRQIIMNLIINASEAIGKEHGEIQVSLATTAIKTGQSEQDYNGNTIPPGEYVCLEVTDNGCGMNEETKWRIFEPFYTTKFTGRGLGMSAVLGIIKSHGGALQLHSQLGEGTTFKVYLPVPKKHSNKDDGQRQSIPSAPWKGSGTILLVDVTVYNSSSETDDAVLT